MKFNVAIVLKVILGTGAMAAINLDAYCQSDYDLRDVYEIVTLSIEDKSNSLEKVRLLRNPLSWRRLNDSLTHMLVKRNLIDLEDEGRILAQTLKATPMEWNQSLLPGVKLVSGAGRKQFPRRTYGISWPVFSINKHVAVIYVRYLDKSNAHEELLVFKYEDGSWKYYMSLFALIG